MAKMEFEAEAFCRDWKRSFANRLPMAWQLREDGHLPWVRFHSLPESKRWPTNVADERIILERAHALGDEVLGNGCECWHVECRREDDDEIENGAVSFGSVADVFSWEERKWVVFVSSEVWTPSAILAKRLISIARDETWPHSIFWMDKKHGQILAPYDGGFDLFLASMQQVEQVRTAHKDWLSPYPGGL
ncbi:DUF3885 domain-containing protein [Rhizobium leguminosarum]|jgi:hypothetical protein|uniref:DUF3885 domain-containing protein n=1 Tax=Rhizobium leguminosarum TaxID=384 RepID=UPI001030CE74|nr:hypothetical protein [Rhizobium leguminosarum]TAV74756.1 hypothetical protein ELI28_15035 [Rhizobium leguminosarum]TAV79355.1 hypothetical protein ELI27_15025 [Rhizobium leguminosarum]